MQQQRQRRTVEGSAAKQARCCQEDYVVDNGVVHPKGEFIYPKFEDEDQAHDRPAIYAEFDEPDERFDQHSVSTPPASNTPPYMSASDHAREICTHIYYWEIKQPGRARDYLRKLDLLEDISLLAHDYYVELMATNFEPLHMTFAERAKERLTARQNEHQAFRRIIDHMLEVFPEISQLLEAKLKHVAGLEHFMEPNPDKKSIIQSTP